MIGATVPGGPGVQIGHNRFIAWGATTINVDSQDFYVEQVNERNEALYQGAWEPLLVVPEVIKVKGQPDHTIQVRVSRYGPLLSDIISPGGPVLAIGWAGHDTQVRGALTALAINRASGWADVLRQLDAPTFRAWPARRPYTLSPQQSDQPGAALHDVKAVALRLLGALSRGEYADVYDSPGLNGLVDRFVELHRAFPDLQLTPLVQLAEGDLVATRATLRGTHLGALYGFPATSRAISWDFFCLARVQQGAVVEQQSLFDWNAALAKLGLLGR